MTPEQIQQVIAHVVSKELNNKIFGPPPPREPGCLEIGFGCLFYLVIFGAFIQWIISLFK